MKILFVAMPHSIHIVRWLRQLEGLGWDLHLVPSIDLPSQQWHDDLSGVTIHTSVSGWNINQRNLERTGIKLPLPQRAFTAHAEELIRKMMRNYRRPYWERHVAKMIDEIEPDIVHVIEFQHAGYLFLDALPYLKKPLPKVILTNWGNDVFLYSQLELHRPKVQKLLRLADYYDCECERDIKLARELGFTGEAWPVMPNTGGHHLERLRKMRAPGKPSERRIIMLKGYQHWQGRSLFALKGLEMVADLLEGYRIVLFSTGYDVHIAAQLFTKRTGIPVDYPGAMPHDDMMRLFGQARIYLCSNISDGLNTAFGEAMVMGAFPVITGTACADEWVTEGEGGLIIQDPESTQEIADKLRIALTDDEMVDNAAEINWEVARERLDYETNRQKAIELYEAVFDAIRSS